VPHGDIMRVLGVEAAGEISHKRDPGGLPGCAGSSRSHDKHIEVIVRQIAAQKVDEIEDAGETPYSNGEQADRAEFDDVNRKPSARGLRIARRTRCSGHHQGEPADGSSSRRLVQATTRVSGPRAAVVGEDRTPVNGLKEHRHRRPAHPAGTAASWRAGERSRP